MLFTRVYATETARRIAVWNLLVALFALAAALRIQHVLPVVRGTTALYPLFLLAALTAANAATLHLRRQALLFIHWLGLAALAAMLLRLIKDLGLF